MLGERAVELVKLYNGGNMPSQISEMLGKYRDALDDSRNRYEQIKKGRFKNAKQFYDCFFRNLIKRYDLRNFNKVKMLAEQFFSSRQSQIRCCRWILL